MNRTELSLAKRRLFFRDLLTFLGLTLITTVLFLVTLFLFRSFTAHRAELAVRWSGRGKAALQAGKPQQAIVALRTALSYAPGTRSYELLLAQALAQSGHTEEASNYFVNLWGTQPGDGFINLALARLSAKKNDSQNAIKYYRASIYGTWEGDGVVRRREVRLELAHYLIQQRQMNAARIELLIAAGNSPSDPALDLALAPLLVETGDNANGLIYYQKALHHNPKDQTALEGAARAAYALGKFAVAHSLLERASEAQSSPSKQQNLPADLASLLESSRRILELQPAGKLRPTERVSRILADRAIAKKRFDACTAHFAAPNPAPNPAPPPLQQLSQRWASATATRPALLRSLELQDDTVQLIYDTELQTSQLCGPPTGDDALLLLLAKSPEAEER